MPSATAPRARYLKIAFSAILFVALATVYWVYDSRHPGPSALPDISLESLSGKTVSLHHLDGKPLVLNLWATWCPPCRAELPLLERSSQRNPDVRFYFAEQGNSRENVAAFSKTANLPPARVLLDTNTSLSRVFGAIGYPTTIFFNARGHIVAIHRGELTASTLKQYLSRIAAG